MKLIFNPEKGAVVKDVVYKDATYFRVKDNAELVPGMIVKIDDDEFAKFLLNNWEFLEEISADKAEKYMKSAKLLQCEKCEFKTKIQIVFNNHKVQHQKEEAIDSLGIRTVPIKVSSYEISSPEVNRQWEEEDKRAGLTGQGLTDETPGKPAIM